MEQQRKAEPSQKEKLAAWKQRKQRLPMSSTKSGASAARVSSNSASSKSSSHKRANSPKSARIQRRPSSNRAAAQRKGKHTSKSGLGKEQMQVLDKCMAILDEIAKVRYVLAVTGKKWEEDNENLLKECVEEAGALEEKKDVLLAKKKRLEEIRQRREELSRIKVMQAFDFPEAVEMCETALGDIASALKHSADRLYIKGANADVQQQILDSLMDDL